MEYVTNFLDEHEYILPLLCGLIIVLLIAIVVCLSLMIRMLKNKLNETETDLYSRIKNRVRDCDYLTNEVSSLQEKLSAKNNECNTLKKRLNEFDLLKAQNDDLRQKLNKSTKEYEKIRQENEEKDAYRTKFKEEQEQLLDDIKKEFYSSTTQLFRTRDLLNSHESSIHYYIEKELSNEAYSVKYNTNLYLFVQVALNSIFKLTEYSEKLNEKVKNQGEGYISKFYRNRSIDFLICEKKYNQEKKFYEYIPLLAIEYDGRPFHEDPKQKDKDDEKDQLFRAFNLPLLRYSSDFPHKQIAENIREHLLNEKTL